VAARRVILTGGSSVPIDFSATVSIKWQCRQRSVAWQSPVQHVGLVLPFSSNDAHHEYNENCQTSQMQHHLLFIHQLQAFCFSKLIPKLFMACHG